MMGKIKVFDIFLADGRTSYYPGEIVRGICHLEHEVPLKVNFIRMSFKGEARADWSETEDDDTTRSYSERIKYFKAIQIMLKSTSKPIILSDGIADFNFSFLLPREGICSSFEGKCGSIKYSLKAKLGKPLSLNKNVVKLINIVEFLDINRLEYQIPIQLVAEKTLCCGLCKSGLISMSAISNRMACYAGQWIVFSAEISNQSSRDVTPCANLMQVQTFKAQGNTTSTRINLSTITGTPVNRYSNASWTNQQFCIPITPPTLNCGIVKVEYFLEVVLGIPRAASLRLNLPIIIGGIIPTTYQPIQGDMIFPPNEFPQLPPQIPTTAFDVDHMPKSYPFKLQFA